MGLCQSDEDKSGLDKSKQIDKQIKQTAAVDERTVKLLLLGAGECGKSTVLKQMRILHNNGFTDDEITQQKRVVYNNTVTAMHQLIKAMQQYQIKYSSPEREADALIVQDVIKQGRESEPFTPDLAVAIKKLWNDKAVQDIYEEKRLECHLHESTRFFLDSVDRISNVNYKPTDQDILLTRIKTTGIVEVSFMIKKVHFRVFDVGGQRSERKKWIHCFENVNAIIFIAAVSEYDEVLFEDETTKFLWAQHCKDSDSNLIGPQTYEDSIKYIKQRFELLNQNPKKTIFVHETCATDTDQVQKILDSVISMIIQQNLHKSGLY
ncbi:g-protein alpha subunit [Teladorsagia circumcincta]|uniref:G-protein alpha subunit n=1 Tax=Teladorsagia circumcincta TaxID=45464 RepID=A0A2G9V674_TELCI|nr:g-protein alpha subunit [Teladorsagia circumcincta]